MTLACSHKHTQDSALLFAAIAVVLFLVWMLLNWPRSKNRPAGKSQGVKGVDVHTAQGRAILRAELEKKDGHYAKASKEEVR